VRPYNALDVADYIVNYCNENDFNLTHIKLQKLLYFIEANYLVNQQESLFTEDIEKWRLGPVIPEVYHQYKTFSSSHIGYVPNRLDIDEFGNVEFVQFDPNVIDEQDQLLINGLVQRYVHTDAFTLVEITHQHEPWLRDEPRINAGETGINYVKEEITQYFTANPDSLRV
jgi:uncharacterized phage-associated protein